MISWKMGDLSGELPHRFVFSLNVGTGALLPPCAVIGALLLPQEVSWLLLAIPSHMDAQGFVQPCGELGQGHDPIKSCAEWQRKQVLTRQFPDSPQMPVVRKRGLWTTAGINSHGWIVVGWFLLVVVLVHEGLLCW